jgi:membrane protease YdiL (CAAX protease family)
MSRIGGADTGLRSQAARPIPSGVEYHRVLAGEERRIGRGILAIVLLLGGLLIFTVSLAGIASLVGGDRGSGPPPGYSSYTPLQHGSAMASIALLIPWSMVIQRRLYGVRGASLHSVVSHFRWDLFGRAVVAISAAWVAVSVAGFYLQPLQPTIWSPPDVMWLLATTFLLTPLQAAGEEYGFRGLVFRVAASWGRGPRTALVLGVLVSSAIFAVIHLSTDPWLNLWYLAFGTSTALVTWRTGGIEIAVVLHAGYNMIAFLVAVAVRNDLGQLGDRAAGAATAAVLVPCAVLVAVVAVVWFRTQHSGPARTQRQSGASGPPGQRGCDHEVNDTEATRNIPVR